MKTSRPKITSQFTWYTLAIATLAVTAIASYAAGDHYTLQAPEKDASRPAASDQATTLNDQSDLSVTVYNSNIALRCV